MLLVQVLPESNYYAGAITRLKRRSIERIEAAQSTSHDKDSEDKSDFKDEEKEEEFVATPLLEGSLQSKYASMEIQAAKSEVRDIAIEKSHFFSSQTHVTPNHHITPKYSDDGLANALESLRINIERSHLNGIAQLEKCVQSNVSLLKETVDQQLPSSQIQDALKEQELQLASSVDTIINQELQAIKTEVMTSLDASIQDLKAQHQHIQSVESQKQIEDQRKALKNIQIALESKLDTKFDSQAIESTDKLATWCSAVNARFDHLQNDARQLRSELAAHHHEILDLAIKPKPSLFEAAIQTEALSDVPLKVNGSQVQTHILEDMSKKQGCTETAVQTTILQTTDKGIDAAVTPRTRSAAMTQTADTEKKCLAAAIQTVTVHTTDESVEAKIQPSSKQIFTQTETEQKKCTEATSQTMLSQTTDQAVEVLIRPTSSQVSTQTEIEKRPCTEAMIQTVVRQVADRAINAKPDSTQIAIQTEQKHITEGVSQTERQLMVNKAVDAAVRPILTENATAQTQIEKSIGVEVTCQTEKMQMIDQSVETADNPIVAQIATMQSEERRTHVEATSQTWSLKTIDTGVDAEAQPRLCQSATQTIRKEFAEITCQTENKIAVEKAVDVNLILEKEESDPLEIPTLVMSEVGIQTEARAIDEAIPSKSPKLTKPKKASGDFITSQSIGTASPASPNGGLVRSKIALWENSSQCASPKNAINSEIAESPHSPHKLSDTIEFREESTEDATPALTAATITAHNSSISKVPTALPERSNDGSRRDDEGTPQNRLSDFMASFNSFSSDHIDRAAFSPVSSERPSTASRYADFIADFPSPSLPRKTIEHRRSTMTTPQVNQRPRSLLADFIRSSSQNGLSTEKERPASFSA